MMSLGKFYFIFLMVESFFIFKRDAALPFSGFEGTTICMNFEQNITESDYPIKIMNEDKLPVFSFIRLDEDWDLKVGTQYEKRIQTSETPTSNLSFCLLNTTKDDAGYYFNQDENITLNVWYGPTKIMFSPEQILPLNRHSSLTLNCTADCNPDCNVTWLKDTNYLMLPVPNELVLTNVSNSDTGNYTCVAKNPKGNNSKTLSKSVQLYVNDLIQINVTPNQSVEVKEYGDVNVTCNAESHQISNISWLRDGELLKSAESRKNELVLYLSNSTCSDSGTFECLVYGSVGMKASKSIRLDVLLWILAVVTVLLTILGFALGAYKVLKQRKQHKDKATTSNRTSSYSNEPGGYRDNVLYQSTDAFSPQNWHEMECDEAANDSVQIVSDYQLDGVEQFDDYENVPSSSSKVECNQKKIKEYKANIKDRKPLPRPRLSKQKSQQHHERS